MPRKHMLGVLCVPNSTLPTDRKSIGAVALLTQPVGHYRLFKTFRLLWNTHAQYKPLYRGAGYPSHKQYANRSLEHR